MVPEGDREALPSADTATAWRMGALVLVDHRPLETTPAGPLPPPLPPPCPGDTGREVLLRKEPAPPLAPSQPGHTVSNLSELFLSWVGQAWGSESHSFP